MTSDRHVRQTRLPQIGAEGQARLAAARVAIVGLGATGSHVAETLARAGVGTAERGLLRLVDRDVVEHTNLQRQALYTQSDADEVAPKAAAAAARLAAIDPALHVEPHVSDLTADDAARLLGGVDLVLDGTDNFPTRLLMNDWSVKEGVPFVYCGVVGTAGQALLVADGSPCLRCYVPHVPSPGALPTCETAGVLGSAVTLVASLVATGAVRVLLGRADDLAGRVAIADVWEGGLRYATLERDPACPCCVWREFSFLDRAPAAEATTLCGRDAVQLPAGGTAVSLDEVERRLASMGEVGRSPFHVRLDTDERRLLVFADGRVIVGGTRDPAEARSLRARLLGD